MKISRLTKKYQTTIPKDVRKYLHLKEGDSVAFDIDKKTDSVVIKKINPIDIEYIRSLEPTLEEWNSKNDEDAYNDL